MFYAVLALLQQIGTVPSKHAGAIALFDKRFVLTGVFAKQMSKDLHRAFALRQEHDYRSVEELRARDIEALYSQALSFVKAVRSHLSA